MDLPTLEELDELYPDPHWPTIIRELEAVGIGPYKLGLMLKRDIKTIIYWRDQGGGLRFHDGVRLLDLHFQFVRRS